MAVFCYNCHKHADEIPGGLKRCARCRITTYCSTECQRQAWKSIHKQSCIPHHGLTATEGGSVQEPKKNTKEWRILEMGKHFGKWMDLWRDAFCEYELIALDLANHPDRVNTHCAVIWCLPNEEPHDDRLRDFMVGKLDILSFEDVAKNLPNFNDIVAKPQPGQPAILKLITVLDDPKDTPRTRCLQWGCPMLDEFINRDKEYSKACAATAEHNLQVAVLTVTPEASTRIYRLHDIPGEDVLKALGVRPPNTASS